MDPAPRPEIETGTEPAPARGDAARLLVALAPALLALLVLPGFVSQDGPAHVANAALLRDRLLGRDPGALPAAIYGVRLQPIPNWAGHALLVGLLEVVPARAADRAMLALTLIGVAGAAVTLARRVRGRVGWPGALLAALLGLSFPWLLGFTSFLLGTTAFLLTLASWWARRDRPGPGLALVVGAWLTLGYFCHPISLGLAVFGLGVLALATPGPRFAARLGWTLAGLLPLVPLGLVYRALMRQGEPPAPVWAHLQGGPLRAPINQALWVDPVTIGRRTSLPFLASESPGWFLLTPAAWLAAGVGLALAASFAGRRAAPPRAFGWLAALLLVGGLFAPDSLGESHGHYLPQRVVLLGLLACVPLVAGRPGRARRWATAALGVALAVQSAWVWDYGLRSDRLAARYLEALPAVGRGQRVAGLFLDLRGPHRANPLLHLDCLLGVGTGNVVWSNYEAAYYYFPVRVRAGVAHPPIREFERISILDRPEEAGARLAAWRALLAAHHDRIDRLVIWGDAPGFAEATRAWYDPVLASGPLRVWRHRRGGPEPGPNPAGGGGVQ